MIIRLLAISLSFFMLAPACADKAVDGNAAYVVQFYDPGIMDYSGGIKGLAATAPAKPDTPPEFDSVAVKNYEAWLKGQRQKYLDGIKLVLKRDVQPTHVYNVLQHAVAMPLAKYEAESLRKLGFVRAVWLPESQIPAMYSITHFVGADMLWANTRIGTQGQGVTIGIIDTGGNNLHRFFQPMGAECGYPMPTAKIVLKNCNRDGCPVGNEPGANCVDSADGLATDCSGHGTYVAGIAAGDAVIGHSTTSAVRSDRLYQGIAKCSSLISYNTSDGSPFEPTLSATAVMQAVEQAMRDHVQIVNMSFGPRSGPANPWAPLSDPALSPILTLNLLRAGILPVSAAGNLPVSAMPEPVAGQVNHTAPWELVVVAATANSTTLGTLLPPIWSEHIGWIGATQADQIAYFSLLGPARNAPGVTKPDLVAPGVNVESAGVTSANTFAPASGTSAAAPVVSGGAALLKAMNPTWTPMEIASAMTLTARTSGQVQNRNCPPPDQDRICPGPWPWRQWSPDEGGSGRVALDDAGFAGFVMNETYDNFVNADPARGGNPSMLNMPYVRGTCAPACVWNRTIRGTRPERVTWRVYTDTIPGVAISVSPSIFTLSAASASEATVRLTITATRTGSASGQTRYGMIWLVPDLVSLPPGAYLPTAHMTVSVQDP